MKYALHNKKRRTVSARAFGRAGLLIGVAIFGAGALVSTPLLSQSGGVQHAILPVAQASETEQSPWRIRIPSLGVEAPIQKVGLTRTGNMGVPSKYNEVGWLKTSAQPGEPGNAVIAGHLNGGPNVPAVFEKLHKLQVGDYIYVESDGTKTLSFRVTDTHSYNTDKAPYEKIFGPTTREHLNLITCDGAWDKAKQDYSQRRVVFSQLVI